MSRLSIPGHNTGLPSIRLARRPPGVLYKDRHVAVEKLSHASNLTYYREHRWKAELFAFLRKLDLGNGTAAPEGIYVDLDDMPRKG